MKLDFSTFAFGYQLKNGANTPNWATALGQGVGHKINETPEINEIIRGMIYSSVSVAKIKTKIGKGGAVYSGSDPNTPIVLAAVFNKVYVNDILIQDGRFILLIVKDTQGAHAGRLKLKYGPSNTYEDGAESFSNLSFLSKVKKQLGLAEDACWFVSELNIKNQNELVLKTFVVKADGKAEYRDIAHQHSEWSALASFESPYKGSGNGHGAFGKRTRTKYPLNCILYGAPGTGKTYATAQYAVAIAENKELNQVSLEPRTDIMERYNNLIAQGQIVFTTFHQNYGYEDFIQGIRPDTNSDEMSFKTVDGVFKIIADSAMKQPDKDYVLIIDEINRANISKVFGELITLIEEDKRFGEENAITALLPSGDPFSVPNNLYIVGTMNSADKSISLIDTALRRRFDFVEYVPNLALVSDEKLRKVLDRLNKGLSLELNSTDLLVGHSYFMGKKADDLCDIMNRSIIPLLYEYFFDNKKKVEDQVQKAVEDMNVEIVSESMGRIKIVKKVGE